MSKGTNSLFSFFLPKPPEVKVCLDQLDRFELEHDFLAFSDVKPLVEKYLMDKEKTIFSIREENIRPRDLVFLLITNAIGELLPTGKYHIYRGMLDITGQDILKIWDYAVTELEKSGFHTHEETEKDKKWIRDQIKNVG